MSVSPTSSIAPNPFNMHPRTETTSADGGDFDQQLASALSESLRRLGMSPGEVNITIRQGTESSSARQILITYNAVTTTAGPASETAVAADQPATDINETTWSPWDGPTDGRDEVPSGGGRVSSSGAPVIQLNTAPASNQYNYTGFGAFNPYFTTPSNPLRPGYVLGFANWFQDASIYGSMSGPVPANRTFFASAEGAQEALRLVRQYEPQAELKEVAWGGAPFSASNTMYYVELPGGQLMNAGLLLNGYYHGGAGVTASSDELLMRSFQQV